MGDPTFTYDDMKPCALCGKGMMHSGLPLAFRVRIEQIGIDIRAVQREAGLEQMMGGHVAIARALSPEREFGQRLSDVQAMICHPCVMEDDTLLRLSFARAKEP